MSDLHLEGHKDQGRKFVESINPAEGDVLVLPGDILYLKNDYWPKVHFDIFCSRYRHVVYVPGNHEYYNTSITRGGDTLRVLENRYSNLHILKHGKPVVIEGRRFLGDTLWFPWDPMNPAYANLMNDFSLIKGFVPWVYADNEATVRGLENYLQPGDIVVTHYLPSYLSVHPKYKAEQTNRFFVCELSNLIMDRRPALWMHGHTHEKCDYMLGETRIVANPKGYLRERVESPFDEHMWIDI